MLLLKWFYPILFNKRNTNHTCTVAHVNREMHIEIGTSSNFAFAFTVAIKETRDHQLQPPTKICTKYRKYIQAFLDFRGFDFRDFRFNAVYDSILFFDFCGHVSIYRIFSSKNYANRDQKRLRST